MPQKGKDVPEYMNRLSTLFHLKQAAEAWSNTWRATGRYNSLDITLPGDLFSNQIARGTHSREDSDADRAST
jgi:hypothetical protein